MPISYGKVKHFIADGPMSSPFRKATEFGPLNSKGKSYTCAVISVGLDPGLSCYRLVDYSC